MRFEPFTISHFFIIAPIPAAAAILARWARFHPSHIRPLRFALAAAIAGNELLYYAYAIAHDWVHPPFGLPFDLCDVSLWLTVFVLLTIRQRTFDLVYYWALVGTGMAVLTPDVSGVYPQYVVFKFFFSHGSVIVGVLFLLWSGTLRPQPGSLWRALAWANVYAVLIGTFNFIFQTNYFYLREKPSSGSLLDLLGPWPLYILAGELVGLLLFWLLWLPFSPKSPLTRNASGSNPGD